LENKWVFGTQSFVAHTGWSCSGLTNSRKELHKILGEEMALCSTLFMEISIFVKIN
jgi:hypothetical protein